MAYYDSENLLSSSIVNFLPPRPKPGWFDYPTPRVTLETNFGLVVHLCPQDNTGLLVSSCCNQGLELALNDRLACQSCLKPSLYHVSTPQRLALNCDEIAYLPWLTPHTDTFSSIVLADALRSSIVDFLGDLRPLLDEERLTYHSGSLFKP